MTDRMDKALRHIETAVDVDEWAMYTVRECFEKLDKIENEMVAEIEARLRHLDWRQKAVTDIADIIHKYTKEQTE